MPVARILCRGGGGANEASMDQTTRSLRAEACKSTIFLSQRFHRAIYFYIESTLNETPVGVPEPITSH